MAITGTGVNGDPYVIHSYNELKSISGSTSNTYVKLGNDIDCNDYGYSWEWKPITLSNYAWNIDLDGHTIKNAVISSGYDSWLLSGSSGNNIIKNGKILNIFNNGARNIFENINLNNVSVSVDGTNLTFNAFRNVVFEGCAVYFKSNKLNSNVFYNNNNNSPYCKYSDFYFEINDINEYPIFENYYMGSTILTNCRVRGYVKGKIQKSYLAYGGCCDNSVIEIDTTKMTWNSSSRTPFSSDSSGIINTEISPNLDGTRGLIACTSAQMRDPDYLNSIGFTVIKVGG